MGHPINSFSYLLDNWRVLRERYPYYAFFLFTPDHQGFYDLFLRRFEAWDELSGGGCMFFAVAPPPPSWNDRARERDYWRHYMANSHQEQGYDSDAVRQAARYFSVPAEYLPAIVLFQDLEQDNTLTIKLNGFTMEEADAFVHNLFQLLKHPSLRTDGYSWRLQSLVERLPLDRRVGSAWIDEYLQRHADSRRQRRAPVTVHGDRFGPHHFTYTVGSSTSIATTLESMLHEMERLGQRVEELQTEQREGFRQVNVRLEEISIVLKESIGRIDSFRKPFLVRWVDAESNSDAEAREEVLAELHSEFDDFLRHESSFLAERLYRPGRTSFPAELHSIELDLEEESRAVLGAAEILWQHLRKATLAYPIDYAVCGIGLWKALEIELNRAFVDALRVHNGLCQSGQPSVRQSVRPTAARITLKGMFLPDRIKDVCINPCDETHPDRLRSLELGPVGALLAASERNKLADIMKGLTIPLGPDDRDIPDFASKLASRVDEIRKHYRNGYAHIQRMERPAYETLRSMMLDSIPPHSPLFASVACKVRLLHSGLI